MRWKIFFIFWNKLINYIGFFLFLVLWLIYIDSMVSIIDRKMLFLFNCILLLVYMDSFYFNSCNRYNVIYEVMRFMLIIYDLYIILLGGMFFLF